MQESPVNIQVFLESFAFPGCALSEVVLIPPAGGTRDEVTESSCIVEQGRPHGALFRPVPVLTASFLELP